LKYRLPLYTPTTTRGVQASKSVDKHSVYIYKYISPYVLPLDTARRGTEMDSIVYPCYNKGCTTRGVQASKSVEKHIYKYI
jgi:hypothetical protein